MATAGSTSASDRPARGKRGMQAEPPRISVSRSTAPSKRASPSRGGVLRAAIASGSASRQYSQPWRSASATVVSSVSRVSDSSAR